MAVISKEDYLAAAFALRETARIRRIPYVLNGMTLSGMDCQGLCEYLLIRCGIPRRECNLAGSNAHYRACLWTGTPEECRSRFGSIPAGAWLFILEGDGNEPDKYKPDRLGNASHMGVYLGGGKGVLQASASRGYVDTGAFNGSSGSGGWNRVGLCRWVDYGLGDAPAGPEEAGDAGTGGSGAALPGGSVGGAASGTITADMARVSTPDGNPVKLRARPSRQSSLYWKVPNGAAVQVEGLVEADGTTWLKSRYHSRSGYIMSEFLIVG